MDSEFVLKVVKALSEEDDRKYTSDEWQGVLTFCAKMTGLSVESILFAINSYAQHEEDILEQLEQENEGRFYYYADHDCQTEEYDMQYSGLTNSGDD